MAPAAGVEPASSRLEVGRLSSRPRRHGAPTRNRTRDPPIKSRELYQLSYGGKAPRRGIKPRSSGPKPEVTAVGRTGIMHAETPRHTSGHETYAEALADHPPHRPEAAQRDGSVSRSRGPRCTQRLPGRPRSRYRTESPRRGPVAPGDLALTVSRSGGTRTRDPPLMRGLLYRLSYGAVPACRRSALDYGSCPPWGSNPDALRHRGLSSARLPVPPGGQVP